MSNPITSQTSPVTKQKIAFVNPRSLKRHTNLNDILEPMKQTSQENNNPSRPLPKRPKYSNETLPKGSEKIDEIADEVLELAGNEENYQDLENFLLGTTGPIQQTSPIQQMGLKVGNEYALTDLINADLFDDGKKIKLVIHFIGSFCGSNRLKDSAVARYALDNLKIRVLDDNNWSLTYKEYHAVLPEYMRLPKGVLKDLSERSHRTDIYHTEKLLEKLFAKEPSCNDVSILDTLPLLIKNMAMEEDPNSERVSAKEAINWLSNIYVNRLKNKRFDEKIRLKIEI
jgi:hypothetical protein